MNRSIFFKCSVFLLSLLVVVTQFSIAAIACATCGCSELCPLNMLDETLQHGSNQPLLSDSIWGNMLLKMAYENDPVLRKLHKGTMETSMGTNSLLCAAAAGTLAQNAVSLYTLNPPNDGPDSYAPGRIGLCLEGVTNLALWTKLGLSAGIHKKVKARQTAIREQVESVLHHLEYSQMSCPEAQKDLATLVGDRAAHEFIDFWQTSHIDTASNPNDPKIKAETTQVKGLQVGYK